MLASMIRGPSMCVCIYEEGQRDGERDFKLVIIFNSYLVKSVRLPSDLCGYKYVSKSMSVSMCMCKLN